MEPHILCWGAIWTESESHLIQTLLYRTIVALEQ